ncbi:MAG: hypothetical protein WDZ88_02035 [Candidatus Paceibacterota bacterium]
MNEEQNTKQEEQVTQNPEEASPNEPLQPADAPKEGTMGPIIGSVIVIVVIILGGIFFWSERVDKADMETNESASDIDTTAPIPNEDEQTQALETQSNSDEIASIESDINQTDLDELDAEMANIEAELEAEYGQ